MITKYHIQGALSTTGSEPLSQSNMPGMVSEQSGVAPKQIKRINKLELAQRARGNARHV